MHSLKRGWTTYGFSTLVFSLHLPCIKCPVPGVSRCPSLRALTSASIRSREKGRRWCNPLDHIILERCRCATHQMSLASHQMPQRTCGVTQNHDCDPLTVCDCETSSGLQSRFWISPHLELCCKGQKSSWPLGSSEYMIGKLENMHIWGNNLSPPCFIAFFIQKTMFYAKWMVRSYVCPLPGQEQPWPAWKSLDCVPGSVCRDQPINHAFSL